MTLLDIIITVLVFYCAVLIHNFFTGMAIHASVSKKEKYSELGVLKGADPINLKNNTDKAVLLIHGFIGSPSDFGRLPGLLYEAGYTVKVPLLPGHGTDPRDFSKTTPKELEEFVHREYRELKSQYKEVTFVGFSLGASLGILTALNTKVDRLILLAPYLRIAHQWYYIFPAEFYNTLFLNVIPYVYRPPYFKQINKKEVISGITNYNFVSLKGADTAIKLGNNALIAAPKLNQPVLIIHGSKDRATDYGTSKKLAEALIKKTEASRFVSLLRTNHMVLHDFDAEMTEQEILTFISR